MISLSSASASSTPATSAKLTLTSSSANTLCLLRAKDMIPPSAPPMRLKKKLHRPNRRRKGMIQPMISGSHRLTNSPVYSTPDASSSSISCGSSMRAVLKVWVPLTSPLYVPRIVCSPTTTSVTCPPRTAALNSLYEIWRPAGARNHACINAISTRKPSTYQMGPPGRAGPVRGRRSPGRLSRGFNPCGTPGSAIRGSI